MGNEKLEAAHALASLSSVASALCAVVIAISTIIIILGGFRYVLNGGDPQTTEQSIMQIIYGGIGLVISMGALIITKIFNGIPLPKEPNPPTNSGFMPVSIILGLTFLFFVTYVFFLLRSKKEPIPSFVFEEKEEIEEIEMSLASPHTSFQTVKEMLGHSPIEQHFLAVIGLLEELKTIQAEAELGTELNHQLDNQFEKDILRLYTTYYELNEESKTNSEEKVLAGLLTLETQLLLIGEQIEQGKRFALDKSLTLIDKRYKKN